MKLYKKIIFSVLIVLGVLKILSTLPAYEGVGLLIPIAGFAGACWFNWLYATGCWPQLTFFKAVCIEWAISAAIIFVELNYFANRYEVDFAFTANYFLDKTPNAFIGPILIAPITVLLWRWAFKEVREADKSASSTTSRSS